jgi:16S rRNA (guanine527-N7)-methyltransferase
MENKGMFHVEHKILTDWITGKGIPVDDSRIERLFLYSKMLLEENEKQNLTGLKSLENIIRTLVCDSVDPVEKIDVPRGTSFVDIGTGSGIPGVALGIWFPDFNGTLIEANSKKTDFIERVIDELAINNLRVVNRRAEDVSHDRELRNGFDWCFTRAFGPLYYSLEFGMPFLEINGKLYIYSTLSVEKLSTKLIEHCRNLGGKDITTKEHGKYGLDEKGLLFIKKVSTRQEYPRRFPIIKREAARIQETKE